MLEIIMNNVLYYDNIKNLISKDFYVNNGDNIGGGKK